MEWVNVFGLLVIMVIMIPNIGMQLDVKILSTYRLNLPCNQGG